MIQYNHSKGRPYEYTERKKTMANKKRKPTKPDYKSYIIQGLIDLLVGLLLILIGKLLD